MLARSELRLPARNTQAYKVLATLRAGPGTFWQVAERAKIEFDVGTRDEIVLRFTFSDLAERGQIATNGLIYTIGERMKTLLERADTAAYQGQAAGAVYRPAVSMPVTVTRRSA